MSAQDRARKSESAIQSKRSVQRQGNEEELSALGAQRARTGPHSLTPADVMQLQRTIGNQAVGRLLQRIPIPHAEEEEKEPSSISHDLGHVVGMGHTAGRGDRDDFLGGAEAEKGKGPTIAELPKKPEEQ